VVHQGLGLGTAPGVNAPIIRLAPRPELKALDLEPAIGPPLNQARGVRPVTWAKGVEGALEQALGTDPLAVKTEDGYQTVLVCGAAATRRIQPLEDGRERVHDRIGPYQKSPA
jgi:hypothetical protein